MFSLTLSQDRDVPPFASSTNLNTLIRRSQRTSRGRPPQPSGSLAGAGGPEGVRVRLPWSCTACGLLEDERDGLL